MSDFARIASAVRESYEAAFPGQTIHVHSDFFELGGDSLAMVTIILELEKHLNVEIVGVDLIHAPTVQDLSHQIEAYLSEE